MSKDSEVNVSGGVGVFGLMGLIFVTLKLCGVINWSWWWVTVPFWGGLALCFAILIIALVGIGFYHIFKRR
jgi:hypothetical protein